MSIEKIIASICSSESVNEAFLLYKLVAPLLVDYKFIFASDRGGQPGFAVNRTFSSGAAVRSLFKADQIFVLDSETVSEMGSGQSVYRVDHSISLDANAMSYLVPHMAESGGGRIPSDFQEVFEFIARPEVNIDPIPYLIENLPKIANAKAADKIFENLKAYEILRTIDLDWLQQKGGVRSTLSNYELGVSAQQQMSRMYLDVKNDVFISNLIFGHQFAYACLVKMATIQLSSPSASIGKKMAMFLGFCHANLATICMREAAVAHAYFHRGQNFTFFGKIQKRRVDLLESLANMAWDMWHIRQLERSITLNPDARSRYFFPAILTFDRRFIEVMDIYPLKACAFKIGDSSPLTFYDGDPFQLISAEDEGGATAVNEFFSDEAIAVRGGC